MWLVGWLAVSLAILRAGATSLPKDERCVTAIYSAYNYISFAGVPAKGMWDMRCQNPLMVTSIYATSHIYCSDRECAAGLAQLAVECRKFGNQELLPRDKVAENLTEDAIQAMRTVDYLELSRAEPMGTPILLSASYFDRMFNTIDSWQFETWSHHAFGYVGYAYWGIILLGGIIVRFYDWLFYCRYPVARRLESHRYPLNNCQSASFAWVGKTYRWLQTHVVTPAPWTTQGWYFLECYFSTRIEALVVGGFWIISIVLSVVGYRTFPGNIYWPDISSQLLRYSADRTGIMSFANFPLLWIFGGRNNIFLWATGWNFATINLFHRHVARVATVQGVVHSVLYTVIYIRANKVYKELSKIYILWGILAFFVLLLLLVTSFDRIRHATYEIFLITHIVLSILILAACFYHTVIFEGHEYWIYLWPSVGVWALDRLLRLARLCYCNLHVSSRGVQSSVSRMMYDKEADVVRLEVAPASIRLRPEAGQYYFLYQPFRLTGWESHPFTVGAWSYELGPFKGPSAKLLGKSNGSLDISQVPLLYGDDGIQGSLEEASDTNSSPALKLIFWIRPYDGWTRQLRHQCLKSPTRATDARILLEGPYGGTFPLWRYEFVLMIVGGTGIAFAVPYIQDHLLRSAEDWSSQSPEKEKTQIQDIELIWSGRQAAFFRDVAYGELKPALGREEFRASFYSTATAEAPPEDLAAIGCKIKSGRPELLSLILQRARDATNAGASLAIVVCGPVGMAREARAATHFAMRQGYQSIKYVEESFTW